MLNKSKAQTCREKEERNSPGWIAKGNHLAELELVIIIDGSSVSRGSTSLLGGLADNTNAKGTVLFEDACIVC